MRACSLFIFLFCTFFSAAVYGHNASDSNKPDKPEPELKKADVGVRILDFFVFKAHAVSLKSDTLSIKSLEPDFSSIELPQNTLWLRRDLP